MTARSRSAEAAYEATQPSHRGDDARIGASPPFDDILEAARASEYRTVDTAAKTAAALGSMAAWIDRAQQKLQEGTEAAARSQAESSSAIEQAVMALEARLSRLAQPSQPESPIAVAPAPTPAAVRSPPVESAIADFDARLGGLEARIAGAQASPRRPRVRGVSAAVAEIQARQAALDGPSLPALGTLARSETAMRTSLRADAARRAAEPPPAEPATDHGLRGSFAAPATRDDVGRLERSLEALTAHVTDLRASLREEAATSERIQTELQRLSADDSSAIMSREIEQLSHKIDIVAANGIDPGVVTSLADEVADIRSHLVGSTSVQDLIASLEARMGGLQDEVERIGARQVDPADVQALHHAVSDMRDAVASAPPAPDMDAVVRGIGEPIERMLVALVDRLERVERQASDPEALGALERQIAEVANRVAQSGASQAPSMAGLEQSVEKLLAEASRWQAQAQVTAETAARSAVSDALAGGLGLPDFEKHLGALADRYDAAESRTRDGLASVQAALDSAFDRIAALELGKGLTPTPVARSIPEASPKAAAKDRPVVAEAVPAPSSAVSDDLLEPGAARPAPRGRDGRQSPQAADVKANFIAAARRAAHAATLSQTAGTDRSGKGADGEQATAKLGSRLRSLVSDRRRPLLLGAAALVIALGVMQIGRNLSMSQMKMAWAETAVPSASTIKPAADPFQDPVSTASITPRKTDATVPATEPVPAPPAPPLAVPEAAAPAPSLPTMAAVPPVPAMQAPGQTASGLPAGIRQAALLGDPIANYELAVRTADGRGVARDPKAAIPFLQRAAEANLAPAQYRLANMYERGNGVPRDLDQAKSWYRRAADAGNVRAMHNLAVLIAEGGGAKPDYTAAQGWFTRAAERGLRDSQFNLAVLYVRGLGTPQDLKKAYFWLAVAATGGDEDAGRKRDEVGAKLSASELGALKAEVARWKPTTPPAAANDVQAPASWPETPTKESSRKTARAAGV